MSAETVRRRNRLALLLLLLVLAFVLGFGAGVPFGAEQCSRADTGDLTVQVVDENGDPIQNAKVSIDGGQQQPVTGANAKTTFGGVAYGDHSVEVQAPGYVTSTTTVQVDEPSESVTVTLNSEAPSNVCEH